MHITKNPELSTRGGQNSQTFRNALSQFATGVAVITMLSDNGTWIGKTISSFNSVSLNPPLILWSLSLKAIALNEYQKTPNYVINVLAWDQVEIAKKFACRNPSPFDGIGTTLSKKSLPIIEGNVAWLECTNKNQYREGDHLIFIGEVEQCDVSPKSALIFHQSRFSSV